jgi:hypothetical protein
MPAGDVRVLKDLFAVLVLVGASVFVYYRTLNKQQRGAELRGLLILGIIITMMVADILYDGAACAECALRQRLRHELE